MGDEGNPLEGFDPLLEETKEQQRREQLTDEQDWALVMSTAAGRRVMWQVLTFSGLFRSSYVVGASREDTWFREGCRNIALYTWGKLNKCAPTSVKAMMEENINAA